MWEEFKESINKEKEYRESRIRKYAQLIYINRFKVTTLEEALEKAKQEGYENIKENESLKMDFVYFCTMNLKYIDQMVLNETIRESDFYDLYKTYRSKLIRNRIGDIGKLDSIAIAQFFDEYEIELADRNKNV
jgi:hypothetical protein